MKGTLYKTENGWVVKYYIMRESSHAIHPNEHSLPLHSDAYSVNGPMKDVVTSWEGKEVEFEIVDEIIDLGRHGSTVIEKAKLLDKWITMMEGDITVNFKPMPEFDEPEYPTRQISLLDSVRANPSWDTIIREFHIATQQVEKGFAPLIFECWLIENYNPPTKKQN